MAMVVEVIKSVTVDMRKKAAVKNAAAFVGMLKK
jgi:hypothetical protein